MRRRLIGTVELGDLVIGQNSGLEPLTFAVRSRYQAAKSFKANQCTSILMLQGDVMKEKMYID